MIRILDRSVITKNCIFTIIIKSSNNNRKWFNISKLNRGELSRNSTSNVEAYDRNSLRNLAPEPEKKTIYGVQPGDFSHQNFLKIQ